MDYHTSVKTVKFLPLPSKHCLYGLHSHNSICSFIENYFVEVDMGSILVSHPTYGEVTANVAILSDTVFAYSSAVVFSNDSSSHYCAVLFTNHMGNITAVTRFNNRYEIVLSDGVSLHGAQVNWS